MSRSRKKVILCKDDNSKFGKRMANRAVRREREVPKGKGYRKIYCSWNICDYRIRQKFYTAKQFRKKWFDKTEGEFDWLRTRFRSWKEAYRHWLKWYRIK